MYNNIFGNLEFAFEHPPRRFDLSLLNRGNIQQNEDLDFKENESYQKNKNIREIPYLKGTTTLAFITKDGIIVAVDSRATAGSFIATQSISKVLEITPYLLGTMAGGAADCFFWENLVGLHAKEHELKYEERLSVKEAAMYLSNCIYRYKNQFSMGTMICGYEKNNSNGTFKNDFTGDKNSDKEYVPAIYYVDDQGLLVRGSIFSVGSGSTVAYGALTEYDYDMEKDDALLMARNAIFHAAHRDAYSGGNVNLYFMNADGWEKVGSWDVKDLHDDIIQY